MMNKDFRDQFLKEYRPKLSPSPKLLPLNNEPNLLLEKGTPKILEPKAKPQQTR